MSGRTQALNAPTSNAPKLDPARLDAAFRTLEEVAAANGRCPANEDIGYGVISALAAAGKIEVEIYGRNFRRVKLLAGPRAGAMTQAPPGAMWRPYAITDRQGTRRTGFAAQNAPRAQPSAPRLLTLRELEQARIGEPAL
jgi:hypothetical protein